MGQRYNCSLSQRGAFISFEGIDGSGKTTQLEHLRQSLTHQGHSVVVAQEPGGTRVGLEIRKLLLNAAHTDLRPIPELLLYFASRAQNIEEVIRPALEAGRIVLVDRFTDATVAYQGYGRELGADTVRAVENVACGDLKPDLTLLLDVDPAIGVRRALERNADQPIDESRMEQEAAAFYERVHRGYLELSRAEPQRVRLIDARDSIEKVGEAIEKTVQEFLRAKALAGP